MAAGEVTCPACERTLPAGEEVTCFLCGWVTCSGCAVQLASNRFCGKRCSAAFFFGGDEDESGSGEE
jgi:hypothetical protein